MNRTSSSRNAEPRVRRSSSRPAASAPPVSVHVERERDELLYRQVYRELVQLIRSGRLQPAARLPSSRVLAQELGIGRNTVLLALEHLMSEGYVETRRGHGTYVAAELPDRTPFRSDAQADVRARPLELPERARSLVSPAHRPVTTSGLLRPGEPGYAGFPFKLWARLLWESWRQPQRRLLDGSHAAGYPPLKAAIADYLAAVRGIACTANQVVIVSGIRQALTVAARLLLDRGDRSLAGGPRLSTIARTSRRSGRKAGAGRGRRRGTVGSCRPAARRLDRSSYASFRHINIPSASR